MIQATQTAQPAQPTRPAGDPKPYIVTVPPAGVPTTPQELRGLEIKRSQLSEQLISANNRRRSLSEQLLTADADARPGIIARLKVLDDRIVRLERDIDRTGDQLANAPASLVANTVIPADIANRVTEEIVPIVAILSVFVLAPFALAIARFIWKRASPSPRPALADQATTHRLEQLQQAVDTIAVEVERISEGQRFVTKLLSERERQALGVGAAEPVHTVKKAAGASSERG